VGQLNQISIEHCLDSYGVSWKSNKYIFFLNNMSILYYDNKRFHRKQEARDPWTPSLDLFTFVSRIAYSCSTSLWTT